MIGDDEEMVGFKIVDDAGAERVIKGHRGCVEEVIDVIKQLYGAKEGESNDEQSEENSSN
jgi:hypothetical protein